MVLQLKSAKRWSKKSWTGEATSKKNHNLIRTVRQARRHIFIISSCFLILFPPLRYVSFIRQGRGRWIKREQKIQQPRSPDVSALTAAKLQWAMAVAAVAAVITKKGKQNFRTCSSVVVYPMLDGKRQLGPKPPYRIVRREERKGQQSCWTQHSTVQQKAEKWYRAEEKYNKMGEKIGRRPGRSFFVLHLLYSCKRKTGVGSQINIFIAPSLFFTSKFFSI